MPAHPLLVAPARGPGGRPTPGRVAARLALASLLVLAPGCGRRTEPGTALSFEELADTAGLASGAPLLTTFEPYRLQGGAMRVRGAAGLPDGTRLQISIVRVATDEKVQVVQVTLQDGAFETPPLMGPRGPLPEDLYRFDVLAHFNAAWQPEHVLRATDGGRALRGPGITRGAAGQPAFYLHEEIHL